MNVRSQSVQWASLSRIHAGLGTCTLALPETIAELQQAVEEHPHAPILGNGSNLIGMDSDSPAIRLPLHGVFGEIIQEGNCFTVGAAVPLTLFLRRAAELGHGGVAQLAGIPGTIGGAVKMNAGALGKEIGTTVRRLQGIDVATNTPWEAEPPMEDWRYRTSPVPENIIVTSATFELDHVDSTREIGDISQELQRRKRVTPDGASCGSVFRNPSPDLPAGKLLEESHCKGLAIGPFSVSMQHANWIVNLSRISGAASQCMELLRQCQQAVLQNTGIALHPEWVILQE